MDGYGCPTVESNRGDGRSELGTQHRGIEGEGSDVARVKYSRTVVERNLYPREPPRDFHLENLKSILAPALIWIRSRHGEVELRRGCRCDSEEVVDEGVNDGSAEDRIEPVEFARCFTVLSGRVGRPRVDDVDELSRVLDCDVVVDTTVSAEDRDPNEIRRVQIVVEGSEGRLHDL